MIRALLVSTMLMLLLLATACSDDTSEPAHDTGLTPDIWTGTDMSFPDGPLVDSPGQQDGQAGQDTGQDTGGKVDAATGAPAFSDTCPPTGAPVTADITLSGSTSAQNISLSCGGGGKPYAQAVTLKLTQKRKVQLKVTSSASLTTLGIWDNCSTFKGCKAGDAKSGMTYEVTRDAGTYMILVGTSAAATFSAEIKLLAP